jgi:hypothetical protein
MKDRRYGRLMKISADSYFHHIVQRMSVLRLDSKAVLGFRYNASRSYTLQKILPTECSYVTGKDYHESQTDRKI